MLAYLLEQEEDMWNFIEAMNIKKKVIKQLFVAKSYKENKLKWAENTMKTDFSNTIVLNELRAYHGDVLQNLGQHQNSC